MNAFTRRLWRAAVKGIQDVGDEMFTQSQRIVNVDRGTLKKSGYIEYLPDGVRWGYRAPYARVVNDGYEAHEQKVRRHNVRAHRRRVSARRTVRVRQHQRGPFVRRMGARKGSHYMERSIDAVRPRMMQIIGRRMRMEMG